MKPKPVKNFFEITQDGWKKVYRGKQLKPEQIISAQDMVQDQYPELVPCLPTFMCHKINMPKSLT